MSKFSLKLANKLIRKLSQYKDKMEILSYVEDINKKYSQLASKTELTAEQEKEIQNFYGPLLGHDVPTAWHRFLSSRRQEYSKYYIPNAEYKINIVGRLNIYSLKRAYTDKNVSDLILPSARQPKILLKNMNGYYYFGQKAVSEEQAVSLCSNLGEVIIKPSLRARGQGVRKINICDGTTSMEGKTVAEVFKEYKSDFLIEEIVRQHPALSALNQSSLNTLRFLTYRKGMEVIVVYSVIRIGRQGMDVDNESAGGISTIINDDGTLGKYAFGAPGNDMVEFTDSGVKLEGYEIPHFSEAVEMVKTQHLNLPYFNLVGWDIAIDEGGNPVMVEFNLTPDLSQSANGPAFGKYTEMILADAMANRNTYSAELKRLMWKNH